MSSKDLHDIYHSCWLVYKDGTRCIIQSQMGEKCVMPTCYPFWKLPKEVDSKVKTMTQEVSKKLQADVTLKITITTSNNNNQKIIQQLFFLYIQ